MAITNIMGFDRTVIRNDNQIPHIEGFPFRWRGGSANLTTVNEPVLGNRTVLRMLNTGNAYSGALEARASEVFHQWKDIKTKWYMGFRYRFEAEPNRLGGGAGITFVNPNSVSDIWDLGFADIDLPYYLTADRYTYMEVCIDWVNGTLERWIDGYKQTTKELSAEIQEADDFTILLSAHDTSSSNRYSRWTDIYFLVDTEDDTPCKRLGGAYVRHLDVGEVDLQEGWSTSTSSTPVEILNTPMRDDHPSRMNPYLISSVAENPSFVYMERPTPGQAQRLGRGKIEFVQLALNAHRYDGSTAQLYATPVTNDETAIEGEESSLTMYVDDYEGRPIAHFNKTLDGKAWTPEEVQRQGVRLYTRSGGGD